MGVVTTRHRRTRRRTITRADDRAPVPHSSPRASSRRLKGSISRSAGGPRGTRTHNLRKRLGHAPTSRRSRTLSVRLLSPPVGPWCGFTGHVARHVALRASRSSRRGSAHDCRQESRRPDSGATELGGVAGSRVAEGHHMVTRSAHEAVRSRADAEAKGGRLGIRRVATLPIRDPGHTALDLGGG